jgi:nucleotide-binding universal stress UspA family protein
LLFNLTDMHTILVPTDFSLIADNALNYAIPIALKEKANIILVHAFKIDLMYSRHAFPTYFIEHEIMQAGRNAEHHLRLKCEWLKKDHNIDCDYMSMLGQAIDVIQKTIKKMKPDLVIMGTKGASGINGMLVGSTAARVIGRAECPVIAVPAEAKYHGIGKIVYSTDLHQKVAYAIRKITELDRLFSAHISVVNIYDGVEIEGQQVAFKHFKDKLEKKFDKGQLSFRLITGKNADDELLKIAANKRYDMLVMTTHQRSFFKSLFDRSVTKKIANSIQIPLLALRSL